MSKKQLTGYPSIDKPWLKYYSDEAINAPLPECTMYEYLWKNNQAHLNETAIKYFGRKISYVNLFKCIKQAARAFSEIGVKKGDIVSLILVNIPEAVYIIYALNILGAISHMIDPRCTSKEIKERIQSTNSSVIVALDSVAATVLQAVSDVSAEVIFISPMESMPFPLKVVLSLRKKSKTYKGKYLSWNKFIKKGKTNSVKESTYNNFSIIVYTGGTTGIPKGVMLSDRNINAVAQQYKTMISHSRSDEFLNMMPTFLGYGISVALHMPLCLGMKVRMIPINSEKLFVSEMRKKIPTHVAMAPFHYKALINAENFEKVDFSCLHTTGCGSDIMSVALEEKINTFLKSHGAPYKLAKGYAMTETSAAACTCFEENNKLQSVGLPLCNTVVAIFNPETNKELPYNTQGEICIHSPSVMLGYYNNKKDTETVLKRHDDGKLWFHTSDLGYMDEDGFLFFSGRIKRLIIRYDGYKIYPSVVENVISEHIAVEDCAVIGIPDRKEEQGAIPIAFVAVKSTYQKLEDEIMQLCTEKLPQYEHPEKIIFLPNLPRTPIGKVDFIALERMAKE